MDIELVAVQQADHPNAFTVVFDVIYAGETWCRSVVDVGHDAIVVLAGDERAVVSVARDALLDLLAVEPAPVSFHLRIDASGTTVLARARPGA
jgi:DNA-binding LacI/PurR family transcriptional regulator